MNKIVGWGHWVVAAIFAMEGSFYAIADQSLIRALKQQGTFYPVYLTAIMCAAYVLCAWGILKWRHWAYVTAIVICAWEFLSIVATVSVALFTSFSVFSGMHGHAGPIIFETGLTCAVFVWLLLPPVRTEFTRRNQIA